MRRAQRTLLALAAGLAIVGCGSDEEGKPIPQADAADIEAQLDNIQGQIEDGSLGACNDIKKPGNTFDTLQAAVENVPESVDADVRDALAQSVDRLGELVDDECSSREPQTETTPEETETVTVETIPEETVPEETVPEETVPLETVPEKKPKKHDEGGSEGGSESPGGGSGGVPAPENDE